jgi:hypothetical protein
VVHSAFDAIGAPQDAKERRLETIGKESHRPHTFFAPADRHAPREQTGTSAFLIRMVPVVRLPQNAHGAVGQVSRVTGTLACAL